MRRRLAAMFSDAFWLYFFPALSIFLPWPWYFRLCRRMTRAAHPYRRVIEDELAYAQTLLPDLDAEAFRRGQVLIRLVDAADFYLNLTRSHRWFRRHVQIDGDWPSSGNATLLLGSHFGAAHWIWRDLRRKGHRAWFLARISSSGDFGRGRLAQIYGRFRGWGIRYAGAAGVITLGGARNRIAQAFADSDCVVALNDAPPPNGLHVVEIDLLDRKANLSTGAMEIALECNAQIVWFAMELDEDNGRRRLQIAPLRQRHLEALGQAYANALDRLLRKTPGHWQIWSAASGLFQAPADTDPTKQEITGHDR